MKRFLLAVTLVAVAGSATASGWQYSASGEPMYPGAVVRMAVIQSRNTVDFSFPYAGSQHATFTISRITGMPHETLLTEKGNRGYVASISIERGQLLGGDEGVIRVRVDDNPPITFNAHAPGDLDTITLMFQNAPDSYASHSFLLQRLVSELATGRKLRVQVTAYQNGVQLFLFNVSGFKLAKLGAAADASGTAQR